MNARINGSRLFKFQNRSIKLRTVMFIQGVMWIVAGASLFIMPDAKLVNVILMSILGVVFIGWGYSIDKQKWLSGSHMAKADLELNPEP